MTSHFGLGGGTKGCSVAMRAGSIITAMSSRHSSAHELSIPRYGNIPTGASPASATGVRESAGRQAVLNSCQGEDHSISRRGGSGQSLAIGVVSGMVSSSGTAIGWS